MKKLILILISIMVVFTATAAVANEVEEAEDNTSFYVKFGMGQAFGGVFGVGYELRHNHFSYCIGIGPTHDAEFGIAGMVKFWPVKSADTGIWFGTGYGTHPLGGYLVNYQGDLFVLLGITRELNDWVFLEINVGFWSDDLIGTSSALICLQL